MVMPPPWLAPTATVRAGSVEGVRAGRLDGTHRVREDPAVVVVLRVVDAAGHETGVRGRPAHRVRRAAAPAPGAALPAGVHHEVRPARGRPQQVLVRKSAPAAVADELHDQRQRSLRPGRERQPALDRVTAESGVRHVEDLDGGQARVDRFEAGVQVVNARLLEGLGPERVEVLGLGGRAAVLAEFVEWKVEQGHVGPPWVRSSYGGNADDHTTWVVGGLARVLFWSVSGARPARGYCGAGHRRGSVILVEVPGRA